MKTHSFRQSLRKVKCLIEWIRKEFKDGGITPTQAIYIIGPVNEESTPDHDAQYREIDPMKPADSEGMFFYDLFLKQKL